MLLSGLKMDEWNPIYTQKFENLFVMRVKNPTNPEIPV
jgi:hypothetical protein